MDEKTKGQGTLKKGIFFSAATCLVIFILWAGLMPKTAYKVLTGMLYAMGGSTAWLIELLIFIIFVGGLILACTKYGNIRIGGEKVVPRFKMWNWIAMSI